MPVSWLDGPGLHLFSLLVWMCGKQKTESTGWLEFKWFKAAPGQRSDVVFVLVSGSGSELTIPDLSSLVCHGFSFLAGGFLPEVPVCGAPVCQQHTRVLLSSLLGNHTSPALWPLFKFCFDPGWPGGCWAVAWLHVALSNPLVVVGPWVGWFWGQCQQEGWSLCRNLRLCSRTGMRAGQAGVVKGRLVWCRLDQQPWQLPFPRRQQWRLPTEHLPCKKAPWCASCKH